MGSYFALPSPSGVMLDLAERYMNTEDFQTFVQDSENTLAELEHILDYPQRMRLVAHFAAVLVGFLIEQVTTSRKQNTFSWLRAGVYYMGLYGYFNALIVTYSVTSVAELLQQAASETLTEVPTEQKQPYWWWT